MNKFIELIAVCTKIVNADLGLPEEEKDMLISIKPSEIIAVRQAVVEDGKDGTECVIYLRNAESFFIKRGYKEMIDLLNMVL